MTDFEMQLATLRAENARLLAKMARHTANADTLRFKVSPKGALSVYGLGRWPMTLYKGQWERLLRHVPELQAALKSEGLSIKTNGEAE